MKYTPKNPWRLVFAVAAAVCTTTYLPAQAVPATGTPDAAALAKYDKNKNGKLDPGELEAQRADEAKARALAVGTAAVPTADEVVQLSPFEVTAGDDKGYAATNSLSGTRLNSKLEDISGSISVVTRQQMLDMAAVDINDIFLYEVGTEGTGQYTDLTSDGRGDYDNVAGNPTGSNRIRGLSQAAIAVGGFTASSTIPIDIYNIQAVEISRGPNSNLAGLSDAGGTVNLVTSRANLTRATTNVQVRGDSYGGYRASLDLNRPIFRDKFSVRFSAVYEEKGFVRKPSVDRINRQQFALTYRPFRTTTVSASYERFNEWAQRANSIMPREAITSWRDAGRPTYDPVAQTFTVNGVRRAPITTMANTATVINRPDGIALFGSANVRNFEFIDGGRLQFLAKGGNPSNNANTPQQLTQSSLAAEARPLWKVPGSTDRSLYNWTDYNLAAPNYETNQAKIFNVKLEQQLYSSPRQQLYLEAAWRREDQANYRRMFIAQLDGVGNTIVIDTNERLLDGRANPYFLRPYIGGVNPQIFQRPGFSDNYRWQLAYQLDLRHERSLLKWLGLHRANLYQEYRLNFASPNGLRYHDSIVDNPLFIGAPTATTNLTNSAGLLVYPLFYVGNTRGGGVEYANTGATNWTGRVPAAVFAGTPAQWLTNEQVTLEEIYFSQGLQKKKVRSAGASLQSFVLQDRVVSTFGVRQDRVYTSDSLGLPLTNNYLDLTNLYNFGANKRWREGTTKTKGVVLKPFQSWRGLDRLANEGSGAAQFFAQALRGFNLHYNASDSFQPADTAYNLFLEALPNPTGQSKEYGFSLNLFDNRFNLRLTHQETLQVHTRSGIGVVATRALSIDFDIPGQTRPFDLYQAATGWQQSLHPEYTLEQAQAAAAKQIGYSVEYINSVTGKAISDVNDAESKGWELELQFNPTRFWTLRATGNQQIAIDSNMSLYIQEYINQRRPYWETVRDPQGNLWWSTFTGSGATDSPQAYFLSLVEQPLNLAITTQGKRKPQTREYRLNLITKYQLAGLGIENQWLKNTSVGGSYRWASKGAIGYYAGAPDSDGVIRKLDRNKPYYDQPQGNLDLLLSYSTRMFQNKIRTNFQLNVRNVTESGHLQGVAVNPDGQFWQYRIIDPRQFILSASFDL